MMIKFYPIVLVLSVTGALLGVTPAPARAADDAATEAKAEISESKMEAMEDGDLDFFIEEVIITARKRKEVDQETPISVSTISNLEIAEQGLVDLREVTQGSPNLILSQSGGSTNSARRHIRGVGANDLIITDDPAVGLYMDGVYVARASGSLFQLMDVERVEVLRGPQGTLFGKNTIGGAVDVHTVRPNGENEGSLNVSLGNYNSIVATGIAGFGMTDNFFGRVAVMTNNHDGYAENVNRAGEQDLDNARINTGRVSLRWLAGDSVDINLVVGARRDRSESQSMQVYDFDPNPKDPDKNPLGNFSDCTFCNSTRIPNSLDPPFGGGGAAYDNRPETGLNVIDGSTAESNLEGLVTAQDGESGMSFDGYDGSLTLDWDINEKLWLKSITGYRSVDDEQFTDLDGSSYSYLEGYQATDTFQVSQEFQLGGYAFGERVDWVTGIYFLTDRGDDRGVFLTNNVLAEDYGTDPIGPQSTDSTNEIQNDSYALFGHMTYDILDNLELGLGLRFSYDEKSLDRDPGVGLVPFVVMIGPYSETDSWQDWSPKLSLAYTLPSENLMLYGSVSKGYKAGGFNGRTYYPFQKGSYDPEEVWAYEVGVKSDWFDRRLRANVAGFYSDYTNMQMTLIDPTRGGFATNIFNAAESSIKGLEFELRGVPHPDLDIRFSLVLNDAQFEEFNHVDIENGGQDLKFMLTPDWATNFAVAYRMPFNVFDGLMTIGGNYYYTDDLVLDLIGQKGQEAFGLLNAHLTWSHDSDHLDISIWGKNLTDERFATSMVNLSSDFGVTSVHYGPPRTYGVETTIRF